MGAIRFHKKLKTIVVTKSINTFMAICGLVKFITKVNDKMIPNSPLQTITVYRQTFWVNTDLLHPHSCVQSVFLCNGDFYDAFECAHFHFYFQIKCLK